MSHRFTQIFDLYGRGFRRFFCLDIWGIFLPIMTRMNLCRSVESVGLLFVVHAKGNSMLPKIKDGDLCVFERYHGGSREGEIVLSQVNEYYEEYGGKYTIKKFHSEKTVN